ncbi:MAG: leucine--tRNA ligase, partial [Bifidobacteriaceae bacterium]|nr:leucine--tRNA ligase [Bifidobacteriaceae bacterium]
TTTTNTNADSASSDADTNYELTTDNRQLTTDKWDDLTKNEQARILNQYRLAYLSETPVNWAPGLGTVVANEEIAADGRTERGNMPVFQKPLKQWSMRITKYAQRLLDGLDTIDWPDKVKTMQRNWIGKSEGALVKFPLVDRDQVLEVYTTRDDTLFGATFMVIAPEHALAAQVPAAWPKNVPATWTQGFAKPADALWDYAQKASRKTAIERQAEMGDKSGVFTGLYALNPITGTKIPIFAADYVLMGYGTGAIMAVPGGDQRDFDFAKKFQLPVIYTVQPKDQPLDPTQAYVDDGVVINSQNADISLNGLSISQAKAKMHTYITEQGIGQPTTNYRLRDWLFSRQRYWGEPFPIVYEIETSTAPVAETNPASVATDQCVRLSSKTSTDDINSNTDTNPAEPITNSDSSTPAVTDIKAGLTGTAPTNAERFNTPIALPESMLPVTLPEVADYTPKTFDPNDSESMPETPLSRNQDWMYVTLDLGDGPKLYRRDANVMPNWAGSCWYYLRYADPHYSTLAENPASVSEFDSDQLVRPAEDQYWLGPNHNQYSGDSGGVDLYVGGVEHAVLHLLYARFWHMVLHDLGYVSAPEPFHKLFNQGYIQAYAYVDSRGSYVPASEVVEVEPGRFEYQGEPVTQEYGKIGKSLKNVVTQDQIIEEYGADTFRLYEMSMGPLDISRPWDTRAIVGSFRFLQRLWRNVIDEETGAVTVQNVTPTIETLKVLNKVIHDVIREMEAFRPNTAIARLIELNNHLTTLEIVPRSAVEDLLKMLAPIAPHIAEELWHKLGHTDTITLQAFPAADPAYLVSETVTCIVQINGKLRAKLEVDPDITAEQLEQLALADPKVQQFLAGTTPKKVIVKQPKVVSIVL